MSKSVLILFSALLVSLISTGVLSQDHTEGFLMAGLPGKIAFVGTDFNIHTSDFDGGNIYSLTNDATALRRYQWPTWSTGGELAYFCCDAQLTPVNQIRMDVFVSKDGVSPGELVYSEPRQIFTYAYWSPRSCDEIQTDHCRDMALLVSDLGEDSMNLEILRYTDNTSAETVISGAPFYLSWSPSGLQMILHRNNEVFEVYDRNTNNIVDVLDHKPGIFQAPQWSPVDDRWLLAIAGNGSFQSDIVIQTQNVTETLVEGLEGLVSFSWSPDGNYVAYRIITPNRLGSVIIVDTVSGEVVATSQSDGAIAFFWSPDSRYIAYTTVLSLPDIFNINADNSQALTALAQDDGDFVWSVIDISTGRDQIYATFSPTLEMRYLLVYFDQFSQSHRIWSPNSTHIVYSELVGSETPQPVISILDITQRDTVPIAITNGTFAVWSFE